jgi:hypothetical protein
MDDLLDASRSSQGDPGPNGGLRGLRDAADNAYETFCENFMECVVPSSEWKMRARKNPMSFYVTPALEAFAVVVYKNAYRKWEETYRKETDEDDETETSSLTAGSGRGNTRHLYTGDSKGSRKYEGWSAEGMKLYNRVLDLITLQRGRPGCNFDRNLMKKIARQPKGGKHKDDVNQAPRVNSNIDQLMQIAGVEI